MRDAELTDGDLDGDRTVEDRPPWVWVVTRAAELVVGLVVGGVLSMLLVDLVASTDRAWPMVVGGIALVCACVASFLLRRLRVATTTTLLVVALLAPAAVDALGFLDETYAAERDAYVAALFAGDGARARSMLCPESRLAFGSASQLLERFRAQSAELGLTGEWGRWSQGFVDPDDPTPPDPADLSYATFEGGYGFGLLLPTEHDGDRVLICPSAPGPLGVRVSV